jgi:hypothetical protein
MSGKRGPQGKDLPLRLMFSQPDEKEGVSENQEQ